MQAGGGASTIAVAPKKSRSGTPLEHSENKRKKQNV